MGILLFAVGFVWALIGMANILLGWNRNPEELQAFSILFNGVLFVLPGLVVAGIGKLLMKS